MLWLGLVGLRTKSPFEGPCRAVIKDVDSGAGLHEFISQPHHLMMVTTLGRLPSLSYLRFSIYKMRLWKNPIRLALR